jgi:hypothetical protein
MLDDMGHVDLFDAAASPGKGALPRLRPNPIEIHVYHPIGEAWAVINVDPPLPNVFAAAKVNFH